MGTPRVTYVFRRPPYQDFDLDTLLVCFYFSRFCSILVAEIEEEIAEKLKTEKASSKSFF